MDVKTEWRKIRSVLGRRAYLAFAFSVSVLAFVLYALLLNYELLLTLASSGEVFLLAEMVPRLTWGYIRTTTNVSLLISVVTSIAIGVNFALICFRLVEQSSFGKEGASSFGGVAVAVLAPACPACATALFAVAGLSSAFALLPFNGTEIKVLALLMLVGSAVWIASQIHDDVCELC